MSFAIGIPTLNRGLDLLFPSLVKYSTDFNDIDIHVIDNGKQGLSFISEMTSQIKIHEQDKNLGVAASWNMLCNKIFESHSHALLLNDDVYLGYDSQRVQEAIYKYPHSLVQSHINWSVVLISKHMYDYIGAFDETFYPAYYEDSDYLYRMKLKGVVQNVDESLNPEIIRISMTQEKDPELVNESMRSNRERYIEKWGNIPFLETFLTPYNK